MEARLKQVSSLTSEDGKKKANELTGKEWTKYSVSVWDDISKSPQELKLRHPAMFPTELVRRLIKTYCKPGSKVILDPFAGSGSTLVSARELGLASVGFEISPVFTKLAKQRLEQMVFASSVPYKLYNADARNLSKHILPNSFDFPIISPPYWNILNQRRTADKKAVRNYGDLEKDLSQIDDYEDFLTELNKILVQVKKVLKPASYFILNVMDLRKGDKFYCFHADIARKMVASGWEFDDIIIWNRAKEYSNLRPLGYPYVFRINKVHEYLLIFQKPR